MSENESFGLSEPIKKIIKVKVTKKYMGWVVGVCASVIISAGVARAADGDPDVKQTVRDASAIAKLKELKDVSLLYVKGMT